MMTHQTFKLALLAIVLGAAAAKAGISPYSSPLVSIPSGPFLRGDDLDHNQKGDAPTKWVNVNTFNMESELVTRELWQDVYTTALANGYDLSANTTAFGATHPILNVTWYDAVKWCNARSEAEGLTPCYYTNASLAPSAVYRTGIVALKTNYVNWAANGYRLPTEAEWEKAARGGLLGNRFPRGNTISHSQATYVSPLVPATYDLGPVSTGGTTTTPVGSFAPNGYGLYDMAGDAQEWCWDFYSATYYISGTSTNNPAGPATSTSRVLRGGAYTSQAGVLRCFYRTYLNPSLANGADGFRCVQANAAVVPTEAQTIQFDSSLNETTLADGSLVPLVAIASSGLPVTSFVVSSGAGVASIVSQTNLSVTGVGPFTVTASIGDTSLNGTNFLAASTNLSFTAVSALTASNGVINYSSLTNFLGTNIVDQTDLNAILTHYWASYPPYITNTAFPGMSNFVFAVTNFTFTVQMSTDLNNWTNIGQAVFQFSDTNMADLPTIRYYRLVTPTNN